MNNLDAAIHCIEMALIVAKANRSKTRQEQLLNGLKILRTHESQGTGPLHSADAGRPENGKSLTVLEKPTLVIQWGGSEELQGDKG